MKYTEKTTEYINSLSSADERFQFTTMLDRAANRFSRKHGHGKATKIDIRFDNTNKLIQSREFGHFKNTTGERVPMAYVNKAWSSCHYESAICKVQIGIKDLWLRA